MELTVIQEYLKDERMKDILDIGFDYVVDAIDTLSPKIFLIHHSLERKFNVVSSMGAGGKFDPTMIRISDISETTDCPLARILRKRLHRLGIRDGFTAVYSPEAVDKSKILSSHGERNKASVVVPSHICLQLSGLPVLQWLSETCRYINSLWFSV